MKKVYTSISFMFLALVLNAQVDRVPLLEIFTSSTCPPCKPASDVYNPLILQFHDEVAVVKYPMSWPGAGDPYYLPEFDIRKTFYSVTGVPSLYMNGGTVSYTSMDSAYFASMLGDITYLDLRLNYFIDHEEKRIYFSAKVEALDNYFDGEYKVFIAINEKVTYDNATTNGETEFHHTCKKILEDTATGIAGYSFGDSIYSGDTYDTLGFYDFAGDYRLPSGAGDAIDLSIEHSVEEFEDLEMIMWVNDMNNVEILQAVNGTLKNSKDEIGDFGSEGGGEDPEEPTDPKTWPIGIDDVGAIQFNVYPNPAKDQLNVKLSTTSDFTVVMTDLLGKQVFNKSFTSSSFKSINVADMPEGVYMLQVKTEHQSYFDRVVIK